MHKKFDHVGDFSLLSFQTGGMMIVRFRVFGPWIVELGSFQMERF
ncbi:MAG: hypothetical protein VX741_01085 [Pseudomonadota bacterium]|nr:hypothetical protein [Pseudomonadota bacterium]